MRFYWFVWVFLKQRIWYKTLCYALHVNMTDMSLLSKEEKWATLKPSDKLQERKFSSEVWFVRKNENYYRTIIKTVHPWCSRSYLYSSHGKSPLSRRLQKGCKDSCYNKWISVLVLQSTSVMWMQYRIISVYFAQVFLKLQLNKWTDCDLD